MKAPDLSLRTRIALLLATLLALGAIVAVVWLPWRTHRDATHWASDRARSLALVVGEACAPGLDFGDVEFVERRLQMLEASPDARWAVVVARDGTHIGAWARAGVLEPAVAPTGAPFRRMDDQLVVETPLLARGGGRGTLLVAFGTEELDRQWRSSVLVAGVALAALLAICLGAGWAAGTLLVRPLQVLTDRARRFGDDPKAFGDLADDGVAWRHDEAMVLTQAFTAMARRIAAQMAETEAERRRAVEARAEALRASNAKSLFLANMSHELRTPLNAIIGYCEILSEEADNVDPDVLRRDLDRVLRASRHLLALISDVLDLSKIEAERLELGLETFDLRALVQEAAASVRPLAEARGTTMWVGIGDGVHEMRSDPTRVRQCVLNLLSNAVKFTERGEIGVRATVSEGTVKIEVRDTGIGMDAAQLGVLFQPFVQADASATRRFGGTGLGLALTRRLCRLMGGDVTVSSTRGEGSTFTITLPVQLASVRRTPPPEDVTLS